MLDSYSLVEYSSYILNTSDKAELEQRLGLFRVFIKLYENHRGLLNEILELENTGSRSRTCVQFPYVQAIVQKQQAHLITNLLECKTQMLVQPQGLWVFGRDRKASLSIQDRRLSRCHAAIQYIASTGFFLIDLKSTNGSFLNGEPVRYYAPLKDGDQVRLGSLSFTFFICDYCQVVDPLPSRLLDEVNQVRYAASNWNTVSTKDSSISIDEPDWDTPLTGSTTETSKFLEPPLSLDDLSSRNLLK
jgi:pSer/pThr/pTyr-binding forkhead associated (FHA) protein